jgi:hypothetical protein
MVFRCSSHSSVSREHLMGSTRYIAPYSTSDTYVQAVFYSAQTLWAPYTPCHPACLITLSLYRVCALLLNFCNMATLSFSAGYQVILVFLATRRLMLLPGTPLFKAPWYPVSQVWILGPPSVGPSWQNGRGTGTVHWTISFGRWNRWCTPGGTSSRPVRRDEVVVARLRIGHTRLTHGHLLSGNPPPVCATCDVHLSVPHILVDCPRCAVQRDRLHLPHTMRDFLADDPDVLSRILIFLRSTDIFHLL